MENERRRKLEEERRREEETYKLRVPVQENSKKFEEEKQNVAEKLKYLQEQRKKLRDEIRKYEQGEKILEEENIKIREEERERDILRESRKQYYDSFLYKDTELKTFYTEYKQQKYEVADQPFPERNTLTININQNPNPNNGVCPGCGNIISPSPLSTICPGCGNVTMQQI